MDLVRIRRLRARYHLPPSREQERARLDGVLRTVLDEALESALERAGVSPYEEICIRSLHVPVRLRLSSADSSLSLAWSLALSESILRARAGENVPGVVRYHSAAHALFDVASGVATDRFDRAWAWRLAGVWRGSEMPSRSDAAAELVAACLTRPELIAPLLGALAARHVPAAVFAGLWRRISGAQWMELARAALRAAGVSPFVLDDAVEPGIAEVVRQAQRMLACSPLACAVASSPQQIATSTLERRRACAALIALEQDPGALASPVRARALVSALADAMHPAAFRPPAELYRDEPLRAGTTTMPRAPLRAEDERDERMVDEQEADAVTRRAWTSYGGLLFLLTLAGDLGLPEEIVTQFARRPFRWVLQQLAMTLVPAAPDDPAVLAFAGLDPFAVPPSRDEEPPTDAEREMCAVMAARLDAALGERIEERPPIAFVCDRAAEIVTDPGWIEVRFSLTDVSTAIRRAGLDRDPDHIPWLGVVMKFVYE
jgi:hypothetical protein